MENPILSRVFKAFGVFHLKFDPNSCRYVKSPWLQLYSVCFTIFLQTFNGLSFYYRVIYVTDVFLKATSLISKIVLVSNWILWIALNTIITFRIILLASRICKFLNKYNDFLAQNGLIETESVLFLHKLFACVTIIGTPPSIFVSYGFNCVAFITIISHYCLMCQFLVGQIFEWTLFERFKTISRALRVNLQTNVNETSLRMCLKRYFDYVDLSRRATKLFELNKLVGVVAVFILLAFYWFYSFEYILKRSVKK